MGGRRGGVWGVCVCPLCPLGGPGGPEWMKPASLRGRARPGDGGWRPPPGFAASVVEERRHHAGGRRGRSKGGRHLLPVRGRGAEAGGLPPRACRCPGSAAAATSPPVPAAVCFISFFLGGGGHPLPNFCGDRAGFQVPPHRGAGGVPEGCPCRLPLPHALAQHRALGGR